MHAVANRYTVETKTIFTLPKSLRTFLVARACRTAFIEFANGAHRWSKPELASWLSGPYAEVTRGADALVCDIPRISRRSAGPIRLVQLRSVLGDALTYARDLLRASMHPEGGAVSAWDAWRRGLIVRCEDEHLNEGWIALDLPDLRLQDRLLSLWAADYLTTTEEYESCLGICEVCEQATFDVFLRARARCPEHNPRQIQVSWESGDERVYSSHLSDAPESGVHRCVPARGRR